MTNDLTINTDDGWNDTAVEANARVLRGALLKFSDLELDARKRSKSN